MFRRRRGHTCCCCTVDPRPSTLDDRLSTFDLRHFDARVSKHIYIQEKGATATTRRHLPSTSPPQAARPPDNPFRPTSIITSSALPFSPSARTDGASGPLLAMSSRPSMGVPQRQPPSRSLSSSGTLSQRPPHQRSLSSQYIPSSPVRTTTGDFPAEPSAAPAVGPASQPASVAQTQYGTPRRGGSRLRLELAKDGITHSGFVSSPTSTGALDPSRSFAPATAATATVAPIAARVIPTVMAEGSDPSDVPSPYTARGAQTADVDNAPLPMPRRRCRFTLPDAKKASPAPAPTPAKKDSRPKPYTIEVPAVTPRYLLLNAGGKDSQPRSGSANQPPTGYADFNPWKGDGPEDHFTQSFIQNGYFDKIPVGQAETGSAKGAIFPSLKHKTGLYALSTVFTGLLASRRHNGQISSASTFKPPPRVTLTDMKREAWLKDLANPATSLRKLSRTIPHGIRGKGLLEQCLNKNVPTDRAVWLAKCVGANEIRAFKRKGVNGAVVMGGEVKWIRDWTVFVEQFVDSVVSSFGDVEWKNKVNYAYVLLSATHVGALANLTTAFGSRHICMQSTCWTASIT